MMKPPIKAAFIFGKFGLPQQNLPRAKMVISVFMLRIEAIFLLTLTI
jgi:hypothetical protein